MISTILRNTTSSHDLQPVAHQSSQESIQDLLPSVTQPAVSYKQFDDASFSSGFDQKGDFPLSSCRNRSGKHRDAEPFEWSVCFETKHRRPLADEWCYRVKNSFLPTSGLGLAGTVMRHSTKEPERAYVCVWSLAR